ncbi:helix-turn-helix domain-containing protein [Mucilaginibacter daejeonensis]|uniref:helix-turn-helix domain-containing protein n=1 Tax=Mucilaginibacter daejeonensis TaxID=398049 RepID=UPI001D17278A|nr:helix-turn-helix transcriptional regulator [Mucilaginibacter daejeonensis]UEG54232.1 helix-turn-helix domain-containing protein [Mucilaginibacter daejeonensis]
MDLHQKIVMARTRSGLTQEELATRCGVTSRTIQRIESGSTVPRSFTLRSIATALNIPFEQLNEATTDISVGPIPQHYEPDLEEQRHFLRMLCLSCFSFLIIPYLHFLIPAYLLKKQRVTDPTLTRTARKIISGQVYWVVANTLAFLVALGLNLVMSAYDTNMQISYVLVFFLSYLANAVIIIVNYNKVSRNNEKGL